MDQAKGICSYTDPLKMYAPKKKVPTTKTVMRVTAVLRVPSVPRRERDL